MTNAEHDKDMIESIEMWLHEIEPKWVEKELAWLDELRTRLLEEKSEKPMNLEEEIDNYFKHWTEDEYTGAACHYQYVNLNDCRGIARHFAKWGAEHLKK